MVPVHRKFLDKKNRLFGFESITLMPEYQNTQAFFYNLDTKEELETEISFPIQLEITYKADLYTKDGEGRAWSYQTSQVRIDNVLVSVNQHFQQHKPSGTIFPPLFVDWFHLDALEEGETIRGYQEKTAELAYGEKFAAEKHATWLPQSMLNMEEFNNCIFPTTNNKDYLDSIRIRLWVGPNTEVTFSNNTLPTALGFQVSQIPAKNKRGQVPFVNDDPMKYKCFLAWSPPSVDLSKAVLRGIKMNCYTRKDVVMSPVDKLSSQKQRERDPLNLCSDFAEGLKKLAKKMNLDMDLKFNETNNTTQFVFPPNNSIDVRVFVPKPVMNMLGYDPSNGEFINQRSVPSVISTTIDTKDLKNKALALVYDTGMVVVDLDEYTSCLSSHSGFKLMSTIYPREDGTLRNRIFPSQVPRVWVSQTNPNLKFILHKFDDESKRTKLDWTVGAYVFGTLTGKVIEDDANKY